MAGYDIRVVERVRLGQSVLVGRLIASPEDLLRGGARPHDGRAECRGGPAHRLVQAGVVDQRRTTLPAVLLTTRDQDVLEIRSAAWR
ncbi:hypothetical protein SAMN04489713_107145 [Actinomadura madurae]|uniref:Uncharacterized protein n=1 Tax=Actinomadura madurae TaxID=1993 RepID=A0A1I5I5X3_9ACTN|nr:hypothetical protein [Actinomadura madurae]SFO55917.1 hypothetical protein SAMN04489713_107145 [Actinomadura madurae]